MEHFLFSGCQDLCYHLLNKIICIHKLIVALYYHRKICSSGMTVLFEVMILHADRVEQEKLER